MFVGKIKNDVRKAIRELISEGIVSEVVSEFIRVTRTIPPATLRVIFGTLGEYVDEVQIQPADKSIIIKFRKEF